MKKLDKLILQAFIGPFILTFIVVVFILLTQTMLKYFDEFVGKGLGIDIFAELLMYFSINMTPIAFPLAVLLSSLIAFGNLGEHFELTAIKSSGISLIRALLPIFIFVVGLTIFAFFSNNYIVPKANLNAYSLLYDIRQKKPSLGIKEGAFYSGIPGYSIKVNKKFSDGITLKDIIIYDHSKGMGNNQVIIADSGKMYTFLGDRYLKLELYKGNLYSEQDQGARTFYNKKAGRFVRSNFYRSEMIFSLASFDLQRTEKELFSGNRLMKNINQLKHDLDSMEKDMVNQKFNIVDNAERYYTYHLKGELQPSKDIVNQKKRIDSLEIVALKDTAEKTRKKREFQYVFSRRKDITDRKLRIFKNVKFKKDTGLLTKSDSIISRKENKAQILRQAADQARYVKENLGVSTGQFDSLRKDISVYNIEINKKYSQAVACLIMFLIGAPLGAIIKKGGLGFPVLVSIVFFIIFYVISMVGEKWAKEGIIEATHGVWASDIILLPIGLFFLRQARNDTRLFESDFYSVVFSKIKKKLRIGEST